MKKMNKDDFKAFSEQFRKLRTHFYVDGYVEAEDFCAMIAQHDPQLAARVKTWHAAQNALAEHVESRSEGPQPDLLTCRINGF